MPPLGGNINPFCVADVGLNVTLLYVLLLTTPVMLLNCMLFIAMTPGVKNIVFLRSSMVIGISM
jgi:hypothetical protein